MRLLSFPITISLSFLIFLTFSSPFASAIYRFPSSPKTRIAIALVGGLRAFELTAESIKAHLFPLYPNADIFIVTPRDKNAWKIYLLRGTNVVAAKIMKQKKFYIDNTTETVIHVKASPHGRQGLLKYLALLEESKKLVEEYERIHGFRYDWILRTRPDAIWQELLPSNAKERVRFYSNKKFYIPPGSDWYGINDRFTLGDRDSSLLSLSGFSSMGLHLKHGHVHLTSEEQFKKLLEMHGILSRVVRPHFPFCILTKRTFNYPPTRRYAGIIAPLGSPSARDGAYCWPCNGETNPKVLKRIPKGVFDIKEFCDVRIGKVWPSNWVELFKKNVGKVEIDAFEKFLKEKNRDSCFINVDMFLKNVTLQVGGFTPKILCEEEFPRT